MTGSRTRVLLFHPWVALGIFLAVSLAFNWAYLLGGFQADDILFLGMLRQDPLPFSWWKGFWSVWDIPGFTSLWWKDPAAWGTFWRPVPTWIIAGSISLFDETAFPLHLLSVLLHGAVAWTIMLLVAKLTGRHLVALLSGIFFVACEDHSMTIGWIATSTDILCVLFVNLALIAHARWLEKRSAASLAASLASLAVALGCKESASIAPVVIVLLSFFIPRGNAGENLSFAAADLRRRFFSLLRDWPSWAPAAAVLIVYLAAYKGLGLGGMNTLLYADPLSKPGLYVSHLVLNLPVMWLATLTPVMPSLGLFMPETLVPLAAAGLLVFVLWAASLAPLRRDPLILWAAASYILSLLPQMGTDASERGLYFPLVPASILLAASLTQIGFVAKRLSPQTAPPPRPARLFGWFILVSVLVPGIALSAIYPASFLPSLAKPERAALTALAPIEKRGPDHVLLLNTSGPFETFYTGGILEHHLGRPIDLRVLSSCNAVMTVTRIDDRSFVLRADRPGWLSNMFARIVRAEPRLIKGKTYAKGLFTATLLEMTPDGSDVLAVRFEMSVPLADPGLLFLSWDGPGYRPIDLAKLPAGKALRLADTSDVWASMM